jgi:hypothetical protein
MIDSNKLLIHINKKTILVFSLFLVFLCIGLYPEGDAVPLTNPDQAIVIGSAESRVPPLLSIQSLQLRRSVIKSDAGYLYRNWTPSAGIGSLEVQSGSFKPSKYMSIIITGTDRTELGLISAYIECENNESRIDIFKGSVNTNFSEAIVATPVNWCSTKAHVKFKTLEASTYVGVGAVYEISFISYLKQSFIGKLIYYFVALAIFSFVMLSGASIMLRWGWHHDPLPLAFFSLGIFSLLIFYISNILNIKLRWMSFFIIAIIATMMLKFAGSDARKNAVENLRPYFKIWGIISFVYFALLNLTYNGLGHWEPNYRFWPATWSSDGELPWMFAEAVRQGWDLKGLFGGGGWVPTDRPPLMSGSLLLLSDSFHFLQKNNDGVYLRGPVYNVASVILNTLWAPAIWWLLVRFAHKLHKEQFALIITFVACIPFVIFNSMYGWPKAYGAAFALIAFGLVWECRPDGLYKPIKNSIMLFPSLAVCSMLAHMSGAIFLAPLGFLYLIWSWQGKKLGPMIFGGIVAVCLLASWSIYKFLVLPSSDPVTKYALTGSFGFGDPSTLFQMISARYQNMNLSQWLELKKIMIEQVFIPNNSVNDIPLNSDSGADVIDKLRAWDFMLLTKGNIGIVICAILGGGASIFSALSLLNKGRSPADFFSTILLFSIITWLLVVMLFIAPAILHHWPQAAVFGLALGGSVITLSIYPKIFKWILVATITYTTVVWIISPLQHALSIDIGSAITLVALAVIMLFRYKLQHKNIY